ncbi:unnamed protein product [Arabis nemorensis]|uniref:F-box domain-containing protein n=1 Tax=Arabis nemorensis TaxID=586526 RepID=A0A565CB61_9BRAS|nr:unnamed protein product [Arabis nemorensis]
MHTFRKHMCKPIKPYSLNDPCTIDLMAHLRSVSLDPVFGESAIGRVSLPTLNQHLPHELVEEILVRLVVKSLFRFNSVSKLWRFTIKSRCFVERRCLKRSHDQLAFIYAVKPAIPWFQQILSPASLQLFIDNEQRQEPSPHGYKVVVYSSSSYVSIMCEVFDFRADTLRHVAHTSSYRIFGSPYLWNGSLYWLMQLWDDRRTIVVGFDLLKETFKWVLEFFY